MPARPPRPDAAAASSPDPVEDLDFNDLPGRWQLLAIGTFFVIAAAVLGLPYVLGHTWLWDHARLVGPVLGAGFLFGTQRWWLRRAGLLDACGLPEHSRTHAASAPDTAAAGSGALTRLRRRAGWTLVRWWSTWIALVLCVVAVVIGNRVGDDVNAMIESQPHQQLRVVKVTPHPLSNDGPQVTVDVPGTGPVDVFYSDYLKPVPHVGDRVDVVVDPDDPTDVVPVAYRHSNDSSWPMTLLVLAGLLAVTAYLGWGMAPASRRAARAVRRAGTLHTVTVQASDEKTINFTTEDGTSLLWTHDGSLRTVRRPGAGAELAAAGDLVPGGNAAVLHQQQVLWTGTLDAAPGQTDRTGR